MECNGEIIATRYLVWNNQRYSNFIDNIIVVPDRRVLDQQLQRTIYQFEHKTVFIKNTIKMKKPSLK